MSSFAFSLRCFEISSKSSYFNLLISSDIVGPRATVRGFLFFDVNHQYDSLRNARLDVPDLAFMVNNEALFFFQIGLAPALR